eukprot:scaffold413156_cov25-Prasinocladus_malaysianus.AAC.1
MMRQNSIISRSLSEVGMHYHPCFELKWHALASDRVAASKATEAARDVQVKLSMMVRAWAAEGISIPVDWESLNFSPSVLSEDALKSIRTK